jgi:hypothetical protein
VSLTIFLKHHLLVFGEISHALLAMIKDICIHGEKIFLVKKPRAAIDPVVLAKYNTVEIRHPYIERYCDVYSKDLADRLSLNDRHLPDALATPTLLNPMFGNETRIVGSGLMSEGQYLKARSISFVKCKTSWTKTILSSATHYLITAPAPMTRMMISLNV